ncbi:MAG: hypothetical protein AVDCRST_MAG33-752, partial [uncultured Thermomicrobiales bacterium]
ASGRRARSPGAGPSRQTGDDDDRDPRDQVRDGPLHLLRPALLGRDRWVCRHRRPLHVGQVGRGRLLGAGPGRRRRGRAGRDRGHVRPGRLDERAPGLRLGGGVRRGRRGPWARGLLGLPFLAGAGDRPSPRPGQPRPPRGVRRGRRPVRRVPAGLRRGRHGCVAAPAGIPAPAAAGDRRPAKGRGDRRDAQPRRGGDGPAGRHAGAPPGVVLDAAGQPRHRPVPAVDRRELRRPLPGRGPVHRGRFRPGRDRPAPPRPGRPHALEGRDRAGPARRGDRRADVRDPDPVVRGRGAGRRRLAGLGPDAAGHPLPGLGGLRARWRDRPGGRPDRDPALCRRLARPSPPV